jgi:hypothetical protein
MSKIVKRINTDNENGARRAVIEDLFFDFNRSRHNIYWMNFVRGIFFGVGSVLGGTVVIALIIWLLSFLVDIPGGVGDFVKYVVDVVQKR